MLHATLNLLMITIALRRISRKATCSFRCPSIHTSTSRVFVNYEARNMKRPRGLPAINPINCLSYSHRQHLFSSEHNKQQPPPLSNQKLYVLRFHGESKYIAASASCGIVLYDAETSKIVWKARMYLQNCESAQEAEYFGITRSLEYIVPHLGVTKLIIQGNERGTVLNQLKGTYQISNDQRKHSINHITHFLENQLEYLEVSGIPAGENNHAKKLAKKAMETKSSSDELCLAPKPHNNYNYDGIVDMPNGNSECNLDLPLLSANNEYVLRFDGGSRGNPGVAGCGMVIFDAETQLEVWCA
jgi:ribonuclease HI